MALAMLLSVRTPRSGTHQQCWRVIAGLSRLNALATRVFGNKRGERDVEWSIGRLVVLLSQTEVPMRQICDRAVLLQRSALAAYRALDEIRAAAGNITA